MSADLIWAKEVEKTKLPGAITLVKRVTAKTMTLIKGPVKKKTTLAVTDRDGGALGQLVDSYQTGWEEN